MTDPRAWPPNPFVYDRPVVPEDLIDREAEVAKLLELADAGQTVRLSAPRRYGKTTLLAKVVAECERLGVAAVYVDLDRVVSLETVSDRIETAYRKQLQGIVGRTAVNVLRTLRPRASVGAGVARAEVRPKLEADARRRLERMLDLPVDIFRRNGSRTLVIFDEFQDVLKVGAELEGLLRSHIQHQTREATYVFAGSHPGLMLALFGDRERPFFGQARPLELAPLDDEALARHIDDRFESTGKHAGEALEPLLDLARGHPQRAMLLAHHLWEQTPPAAGADHDTWAATLEAVDRELDEGFQRTWERLGKNESRVLAATCAGDESLFSQRTLVHFGLTKSGAEKGRDRLLEFGDVRRLPNGQVNVVDPLLERWVRRTQARTSYAGLDIGADPL